MIVDGTALTKTPAKVEAVAMTTLTLTLSGVFIQQVSTQSKEKYFF